MHTGCLVWCPARGVPSSSGSYCSSPLNPACQAPRFGSYSPLDRLFPHPLVTLCRNFQLPVLSRRWGQRLCLGSSPVPCIHLLRSRNSITQFSLWPLITIYWPLVWTCICLPSIPSFENPLFLLSAVVWQHCQEARRGRVAQTAPAVPRT